ncbi:MAG TPA: hypothetical protein QGG47_10455 [Acidobacteriota bacterium]|nr:hypothetical protein [Acidobacteriota bacterium]
MIDRRSRVSAIAILTLTGLSACTPIPAPDRSQSDSPGLPPIERGELLPDLAFVDADGNTIRTADLRGAIVVLTFAAAGAPFADDLLERLAAVEERLAGGHGASTRFVVFALGAGSPSADVSWPERRSGWLVLTRPVAQIADLATRFGVMTWEEDDGLAHTLRVAVAGPSGRITELLEGLSPWSVEDLLATVAAAD